MPHRVPQEAHRLTVQNPSMEMLRGNVYYRERMLVQRELILFLMKRLEKILPCKQRNEYVLMIIRWLGDSYREWFDQLQDTETVTDFIRMYAAPNGPQKVFEELFPGIDVDDFLRACLNGDTVRNGIVRELSDLTHEEVQQLLYD